MATAALEIGVAIRFRPRWVMPTLWVASRLRWAGLGYWALRHLRVDCRIGSLPWERLPLVDWVTVLDETP